jgi:hypothetical protein
MKMVTLGVAGFAALLAASFSSAGEISLTAKIPIPAMTGTWDHLTADGASGRLFLSAQDQQIVDVVDLRSRRPIHRITGIFNRPQGEYYIPGLDELAVTNGRDGTCKILDGRTYELKWSVQLAMGADMMEYDPATQLLYAESGGKDSNRGPGKLTLIDATSGEIKGEIVTDFRSAALAMERKGETLYDALPGANEAILIDRPSRRITKHFAIAGRPASMALDESNRRLFVATRTWKDSPAKPELFILDADTGALVESLPSTDATENMFYDAASRRIYTSSLEGAIEVFTQADPDHYSLTQKIPATPHAGTSQFIPDLHLFCVALPPHEKHKAAVWVFDTSP